mgnify:CR=1 FL=1
MEGLGVVDRNFWKGRRVFVTGQTGFKGAWLALWLEQLGARVTGFSNGVPSEPSVWKAASVGRSMASVEGDVRDLSALSKELHDAQPEVVFHLAAQSLVRLSYDDPAGTFSTNIMGTVNLFEAVRKTASVRAVINITSDKCYENRELDYAYREGDPMGGRDPYSASKGCAELVTSAYRQSFFAGSGVGLASVRAGNVIGGGDWSADRLVPDCVRAFAAGEQVIIRNPRSIRPWQHVLEALRGYLLLGQKLSADPVTFSHGYNFGPDSQDAQPVSYVVEKLRAGWGEAAAYRIEQPGEANNPHEAHFLSLDSTKARTELGWRPRWALDRTLTSIVDWHTTDERSEEHTSELQSH